MMPARVAALFLCGFVAACTPTTIAWPPNDGCAAPPVDETLAIGTTIDRFGGEDGTFFSPRGEPYRSRSMPHACERLPYRVYRVARPLPVRRCMATPWFGAPGGAVTLKTTRSAGALVSDGTLVVVSTVRGDRGEATPQCE